MNNYEKNDNHLVFWSLVINVKQSWHKLTATIGPRTVAHFVHKGQLEGIECIG